MCIAIWKPAGIKLHEIVYRNSFSRNEDGAGFAWAADGKLNIKKGIMDIEEFVKEVKALEEHEMIIHCRRTSRGPTDEANCHPFTGTSKTYDDFSFALIHNGTLPWRHTDKRSDTSMFVEDVVQPIIDRDPWFFDFGINRLMMSKLIGGDNKLVIMVYNKTKNEFSVEIVNESAGIKYKGCWFSNLSFTDDHSRTVIASDHKKYENWKPKLFVEIKTDGKTQDLDSWWENYRDGVYGGPSEDAPRNDRQIVKVPPKLPPLVWEPGYGWYNPDPASSGPRCLKEMQAWRKKNNTSDPSAPFRDGMVDSMPYLNDKDMKSARRECIKLLLESYPGFDFKGMETDEIAAWARSELRGIVPEFKDLSNQQVMSLIIRGEFKDVTL